MGIAALPEIMNAFEIGVLFSLVTLASLIFRYAIDPDFRSNTRSPTYTELKREAESLREAQHTFTEEIRVLKNRLQTAESDRQNLEIRLAALQGEMGRSR